MGDLPDYTKYITQNVEIPDFEQGPVIARPKGGVLVKGDVTTTASYATVVERTVTDEYDFQLCKILVSCDEDVKYRIRWNGSAISAEVLVSGDLPWTDWFPWDYYEMEGDGSKKVDIQVKFPSGGSAGECHVELVGEEVEV